MVALVVVSLAVVSLIVPSLVVAKIAIIRRFPCLYLADKHTLNVGKLNSPFRLRFPDFWIALAVDLCDVHIVELRQLNTCRSNTN